MENYDLTKLIKSIKEGPAFSESPAFYLDVIASLSSISVFLSLKREGKPYEKGLQQSRDRTYFQYAELFSKRFDSISFSAYQENEILDFSVENLLICAIRDFAIFAKEDKKLALMDLISSFRYFLTFMEEIRLDHQS